MFGSNLWRKYTWATRSTNSSLETEGSHFVAGPICRGTAFLLEALPPCALRLPPSSSAASTPAEAPRKNNKIPRITLGRAYKTLGKKTRPEPSISSPRKPYIGKSGKIVPKKIPSPALGKVYGTLLRKTSTGRKSSPAVVWTCHPLVDRFVEAPWSRKVGG